MSRRKRKQKDRPAARAKGVDRSELILRIVASDSTFAEHAAGEKTYDRTWIGKCLHCNTRICVDQDGSTLATIEHIVPLCAGGSGDDLLNLALACVRCNNHKGIAHDPYYPRDPRACEVIHTLLDKRLKRFVSAT